MARKVVDATLDTREARSKKTLKAQGKPHYRMIEPGLHLGYRKLKGRAGTWVVRQYLGNQEYEVRAIGTADDLSDADGIAVLSFKQAQDKAREMMVGRAHDAAGKGPYSVRRAIRDYLRAIEDRGQNTYDASKQIDAHILPQLGDREVSELTTKELREWLIALSKAPPRLRTSKGAAQNYSAQAAGDDAKRARKVTANRVFAILRAALNYAWREGRVSSDAAWRRVEQFKRVDSARARYLSVSEAQRLVNACTPAFRPMIETALATGCRYGELTRLNCNDFDSAAGTVRIGKSKTGRARHVILSEEGIELFRTLTVGRPGSAIMLPRPDGLRWAQSQQAPPMREACDAARIQPAIAFHGLRHTWASLSIMAGMPLQVAAANLGHVDTTMVEKHYGHLGASYKRDTVRAHAPQFGFSREKRVVPIDR
jgi:integrase